MTSSALLFKTIAALLIGMPLLLTACGGETSSPAAADSPVTGGPAVVPATFTFSVATSDISIGQGQEGMLVVRVVRDAGFSGAVDVTVKDPPSGLLIGSLTMPANLSEGSLPLSVSTRLAAGSSHTFEIVAAGAAQTRTIAVTVGVVAPMPYAQDNIAAALQAGTIDYGTSLLYRFYALMADSRLPASFIGAGSAREDNEVRLEAVRSLTTLPPAMQDQLLPFVVRPSDPRSIWNARKKTATSAAKPGVRALTALSSTCTESNSWVSKLSANSMRIWAFCFGDPAIDAESMALVDKVMAVLDTAYGPMTALMGKPLPDQDGGDDAIDVYILDDTQYVDRWSDTVRAPAGAAALADNKAAGLGGNGESAYITIRRSVLFGSLWKAITIHEFFHVLQFAHNAQFSTRSIASTNGSTAPKETHWFDEASAAWAEAYFERTLGGLGGPRASYQDVHRMFAQYFLPGKQALNAPGRNAHTYAAYIWPYFVEQETGSAQFMHDIWYGLDTVTSFEEADKVIDRVFPFDGNFKLFALRNLNNEFLPGDPLPKKKRYVSLDPDQFKDDFALPPILEGRLAADQEYSNEFTVNNLSAQYLHLTVNTDGATPVSQVVFDTSGLKPNSAVAVQALILTSAGWVPQPIDIVAETPAFCFDQGPSSASVKGSFREVLLVVSNHALATDMAVSGALKVRVKSAPCVTGWIGSIETTSETTRKFDGGSSSTTATTTAELVFELDKDSPDLRHVFKFRTGSYAFRELYDNTSIAGSCRSLSTASGAMHPAVATTDASAGALKGNLYTFESPAEPLPQYVVENIVTQMEGNLASDCGSPGKTVNTLFRRANFLWSSVPGQHDITEGGSTIEGRYDATEVFEGGSTRGTAKWRFQKKPL